VKRRDQVIRVARAVARRLPSVYAALGSDEDCGVAALELAIALHDGHALRTGLFVQHGKARRHAWACTYDGYVVDLTARQFGDYPGIYVTTADDPSYVETAADRDAIAVLRTWQYSEPEFDSYARRIRALLRCETCHGLLDAIGGQWSDCAPCEAATRTFNKITRESGDADYAYHELAHHVVLFRCLPRCQTDWEFTDTIERFPLGRSQLHELRVLALQHRGYQALGWRPSIRRLVDLSWPGIRDVDGYRGRLVVWSETEARRAVRRLLPKISPRNVQTYVRGLRALRGETTR
jgi:hypothetical protein